MLPERTKMLSRGDILRWIEDSLEGTGGLTQHPIKRIEDLGDGVYYCLLVSRFCGPKILQETAVNRHPKSESDMLSNYKQLQAAFTRMKLFRPIDVANSNYAGQQTREDEVPGQLVIRVLPLPNTKQTVRCRTTVRNRQEKPYLNDSQQRPLRVFTNEMYSCKQT